MQKAAIPAERLRLASLSGTDREALRDVLRQDRLLPDWHGALQPREADVLPAPERVFGRRVALTPQPTESVADIAPASHAPSLSDQELAEVLRARLQAKRAARQER
jgi:hypothetical protein